VNWFHLTLDRVQWQALMNMALNLWFNKRREIFHTMSRLLASQGVLCSVKFICRIFDGTVPLTVHNMIFHEMELFCPKQWKG
jgi:hypothetical protein